MQVADMPTVTFAWAHVFFLPNTCGSALFISILSRDRLTRLQGEDVAQNALANSARQATQKSERRASRT